MSQDPFSSQVPATVDADDFLMAGGGIAAKFPEIGHSYTGIVLSKRSEQQRDYDDASVLKTWDDGNPMMQVVVELQTDSEGTFDSDGEAVEVEDDDGIRSLYVKGPLQRAIRDAVRKSGAPTLELFGMLTVTYSAKGKQNNPRFKPPKLYRATYVPQKRVVKNDPLLLRALFAGENAAGDPFGDTTD